LIHHAPTLIGCPELNYTTIQSIFAFNVCEVKFPGEEYRVEEILVVGTIRNVESSIRRDILRFEASLNSRFHLSFFLVESDSSDNTIYQLQLLSTLLTDFRFLSLGNLEGEIPDRIERIRFARNQYVNEIRSNPKYTNYGYIVVADLDGVNSRISKKSFTNVFESEVQWDVITANQLGKYYDLLALRHPFWSPNNCFSAIEWFTPYIGQRRAWRNSIFQRMIRIPESSFPIEVHSAFGGLSVNKKWVFEKCDYSRRFGELTDENEHVTLNSQVRSLGGKVFIQPNFINARWTTHSIHGIRLVHNSKLISDWPIFKVLKPFLRQLTKLIVK
jgi:hypothetical protein